MILLFAPVLMLMPALPPDPGAVASAALQRSAVEWLVQSDVVAEPVDAVGVHGGGGPDGYRELPAIKLWREGRAGHIVALGGPLPAGDPDVSFAGAVSRRLKQRGVPDDAIVRLDRGSGTAGELRALRHEAEARGWTRVALASERWHTRRISLLAGQVFAGSGIQWSVVAEPNFGFDSDAWWGDRRTRAVVVAEWLKLAFAAAFPSSPEE